MSTKLSKYSFMILNVAAILRMINFTTSLVHDVILLLDVALRKARGRPRVEILATANSLATHPHRCVFIVIKCTTPAR